MRHFHAALLQMQPRSISTKVFYIRHEQKPECVCVKTALIQCPHELSLNKRIQRNGIKVVFHSRMSLLEEKSS